MVEDDPAFMRATTRALRREPVRLLSHDGGGPVLAAIGEESPAVALVDWHLSGGDARGLVETMTLAHPDCVVLVYSGDTRIEERRLGLNAGAWMWVPKLEAVSIASYVAQALVEHRRRSEDAGLTLEQYQGRLVAARIQRFGGNVSAAARTLGISRHKASRIFLKWKDAG